MSQRSEYPLDVVTEPPPAQEERTGSLAADADKTRVSRECVVELARALSLRDLAGFIAHEVSQPLGAMLLNASAGERWLSHDPPRLDEARAATGRILRDARQVRTAIEAIREAVPDCAPAILPLDLNDAIRRAIDLSRERLTSSAIDVQFHPGTLPEALGDRAQIVLTMMNLLDNAIDAMTDAPAPRVIRVSSAFEPAVGLVVSVRDRGTGLDPRAANRIFLPMFTTKPGAQGFGLSMCRRIVEAHGGRLWAAGNEDRGATFCFSLPAAEPSDDG